MAQLYLLDTNILSHLVRQPQGPVAERIADVGEANVLTSVIVACELRYGAARRGSRRLTRQVEAILDAMTIRALESDVERFYAPIRVTLEKRGTPISAHDLLIAAHARAIDAICVTERRARGAAADKSPLRWATSACRRESGGWWTRRAIVRTRLPVGCINSKPCDGPHELQRTLQLGRFIRRSRS